MNTGNPIVDLQSIDPIRVDFGVPQKYLAQIKEDDQLMITSDALSKSYVGKIYAIDSLSQRIQTRVLFPPITQSLPKNGSFIG